MALSVRTKSVLGAAFRWQVAQDTQMKYSHGTNMGNARKQFTGWHSADTETFYYTILMNKFIH